MQEQFEGLFETLAESVRLAEERAKAIGDDDSDEMNKDLDELRDAFETTLDNANFAASFLEGVRSRFFSVGGRLDVSVEGALNEEFPGAKWTAAEIGKYKYIGAAKAFVVFRANGEVETDVAHALGIKVEEDNGLADKEWWPEWAPELGKQLARILGKILDKRRGI
jgi:hypothetical protein